jgi:hypothetical protein
MLRKLFTSFARAGNRRTGTFFRMSSSFFFLIAQFSLRGFRGSMNDETLHTLHTYVLVQPAQGRTDTEGRMLPPAAATR